MVWGYSAHVHNEYTGLVFLSLSHSDMFYPLIHEGIHTGCRSRLPLAGVDVAGLLYYLPYDDYFICNM